MPPRRRPFFGVSRPAPTAPAGTNVPPPLPDAKGGLLDNLQKMLAAAPAAPAPAPGGPSVPRSQ